MAVIFSAIKLEIMSEADAASLANLEDEREQLMFELIVLKGHLIKDNFYFSRMIDPLLDDTAPATIEIHAKMKRLVARLKAQLATLNKPYLNKPTTPSCEGGFGASGSSSSYTLPCSFANPSKDTRCYLKPCETSSDRRTVGEIRKW